MTIHSRLLKQSGLEQERHTAKRLPTPFSQAEDARAPCAHVSA